MVVDQVVVVVVAGDEVVVGAMSVVEVFSSAPAQAEATNARARSGITALFSFIAASFQQLERAPALTDPIRAAGLIGSSGSTGANSPLKNPQINPCSVDAG